MCWGLEGRGQESVETSDADGRRGAAAPTESIRGRQQWGGRKRGKPTLAVSAFSAAGAAERRPRCLRGHPGAGGGREKGRLSRHREGLRQPADVVQTTPGFRRRGYSNIEGDPEEREGGGGWGEEGPIKTGGEEGGREETGEGRWRDQGQEGGRSGCRKGRKRESEEGRRKEAMRAAGKEGGQEGGRNGCRKSREMREGGGGERRKGRKEGTTAKEGGAGGSHLSHGQGHPQLLSEAQSRLGLYVIAPRRA